MKRALKNKELKNVATVTSDDPLDTKIAILSVSIAEKWATLLEIVDSKENSSRKHDDIHKPKR